MRIRNKLLGSYTTIVAATALFSFLSYQTTNTLEEEFTEVSSTTLPELDSLNSLRYSEIRLVAFSLEMSLLMKTLAGHSNPGLLGEEQKELEMASDAFEKALHQYLNSPFRDDTPEQVRFRELITEYGDALQLNLAQLISLQESQSSSEAVEEKMQDIEAYEFALSYIIDASLDKLIQQFEQDKDSVLNAIKSSQVIAVIVGPLAVVTAILMAFMIAKNITRRLSVLKNAALKLAGGHLDTKIPETTGDELGDLARTFNEMTTSLKEKGAELVMSKTQLDVLTRMVRDHFILTDEEEKITHIGEPLSSTLGYKSGELIDQAVGSLFAEEERHLIHESWVQRALQGIDIGEIHTCLISKNGENISVLLKLQLLKNASSYYGLAFTVDLAPGAA